jgi:hypothetical protein
MVTHMFLMRLMRLNMTTVLVVMYVGRHMLWMMLWLMVLWMTTMMLFVMLSHFQFS